MLEAYDCFLRKKYETKSFFLWISLVYTPIKRESVFSLCTTWRYSHWETTFGKWTIRTLQSRTETLIVLTLNKIWDKSRVKSRCNTWNYSFQISWFINERYCTFKVKKDRDKIKKEKVLAFDTALSSKEKYCQCC